MKYSHIRTAFLTFALGLASVPFTDYVQARFIESSIILPEANSEILVVNPTTKQQFYDEGWSAGCFCGSGGGGKNVLIDILQKKRLKFKHKH